MPSPGVASTWGAELFAAYVLDHLATESVLLRSGARRINVTGAAAHVPRLLTDGTAAWTAEAAEIGSTAPSADEILLAPKKLANTVVLSNESVADNEVDVLDAVGLALTRSVATALDTAAFDATVASATRPAGLRSAGYTLPTIVGTVADAAGVDAIRVAVGTVLTAGGHPNSIYLSAAD